MADTRAKAQNITASTLIPINRAANRFSDTARTESPKRVR